MRTAMLTLALAHPTSPDHAADFTRDGIALLNERGFKLDYSPMSLQVVDGVLQCWRDEGATVDDMLAPVLFGLGCYVGEVVRRELGGPWIASAEEPVYDTPFPILLELDALQCDPITATFYRLEWGPR